MAPMPTSGVDAHRLQNRRQFDAAGMTCRSSRGGNTIEPRQYLGADLADERNIERVRQAVHGMAVESDAIAESLLQSMPEVIAQGAHPIHRLQGRAQARRPCRGRPRAGRSRCPRAGHSHVRRHESAVRAIRRGARTGRRRPWRIELVAGDRQQIDSEFVDSRLEFCRRTALHRCETGRRARGRSRAQSSIGWMVPTSLLACMMLTRIVRGVIALRRSSGSTRPVPSTGRIGHPRAKPLKKSAAAR